jgi:hypothetical protein
LVGLDDVQLLAALSALVRRENDWFSDLLAHFRRLPQAVPTAPTAPYMGSEVVAVAPMELSIAKG